MAFSKNRVKITPHNKQEENAYFPLFAVPLLYLAVTQRIEL